MAENRGTQNPISVVNELTQQVNALRTRVKFKTSLMIFIIALLVMVTATLAWFTISGLAGTDGLDLNCTTGNDLRIATSNRGSDVNAYERKVTSEMVDANKERFFECRHKAFPAGRYRENHRGSEKRSVPPIQRLAYLFK